MHDKLEKSSQAFDWPSQLKKIKQQDCKYHCLIGISGGLDSSMLLLWAVKNGLNPLVIHFDNGWNTPEAEHNMETLTKKLMVDFIRYPIDREGEYDLLCKSFLYASVHDADIPNDMAMAALMMRTADKYGIKYILNGHNFRTEGSSPISWSYMDARYVQSVYKYWSSRDLFFFPLLTFWEQIYYALKGITHVRPFYYIESQIPSLKQSLMSYYDWRPYGDKHAENLYTEFIGYYYLPKKFGINKSLTYNSALIRSGKKTKAQYESELQQQYEFSSEKLRMVLRRLAISEEQFKRIMEMPASSYKNFKTYHKTFRRYKWLLYILMRMKLIPYTFYKKYTA